MNCLITDKPVEETNGPIHCRCDACFAYLCKLEDEATCPHGFLVGCPTCIAALRNSEG